MRKILFLISIFLFVFVVFQNATAQVEVVRSTEMVVVKNKKYYLHIVRKGETLFSISQAYKVKRNEIGIENPEVFDADLSIGQSLKIPIFPGRNSTEEEILYGDKYIFHIIEKGQTPYFLSKKYNVPLEVIYENNPGSNEGIKIGQVIKIPKSDVAPKDTNENIAENNNPDPDTLVTENDSHISEEDGDFILHVVQKKETLWRLGKQYDISRDQIINDNPDLKETGLVADDTIRIRKMKMLDAAFEADNVNENAPSTKDTLALADTNRTPCDSIVFSDSLSTFNVALLLPFNLDEADIIKEENIKEGKQYFPKAKPFIEFYEGSLIALDSLRKQGMNINYKVYNTDRDTFKVEKMLEYPEFKTLDLIIGPVFSSNLRLVTKFAKDNAISMVSPFYTNNEIAVNNPYVFQVNPSLSTQLTEATAYFAGFNDKNMIFIHQGESKEVEFVKIYKSKFNTVYKKNFPQDTSGFVEINYKEAKIAGVEKVLKPDVENVIIIPSTDQPFVSDVITRLHTFCDKKKIVIYGLPAWNRFDNIELEYIHDMNMHNFSPYYVDFNNKDVKDFVAKYRKAFKTEPVFYRNCNYSFWGYDISMYFLTALKEYGHDFRFCVEEKTGLQSRFNFERINEFSGFENNGTYIIRFNKGYDVAKVDPRNFQPEEAIINFETDKK